MSDTPTPRTNDRAIEFEGGVFFVPHQFARQLERELNAANARITELEAQLKDFRLACGTADLGKWENWLDRAHAKNAQLKAELDRLASDLADSELDRRRLDWVISTAGLGALWARWEYAEPMHRNDPMTREELDAAMKTDLP